MRLILVAIGLYMIWGYSAAQAELRYVKNRQSPTPRKSRTYLVAQNSATTVRAPAPQVPLAEKSDFAAIINLEASSNMRDRSAADYSAANTLLMRPSYQILEALNIMARIEVTKNYGGNEDTELANTQLVFGLTPYDIGGGRSLALTAVGVLPTNEKDRNNNTFNGATGASVAIAQDYTLNSRSGKISYAVSGLKNYHDFDRTNLREPNLSYRFRQILTWNQQLSDSFNLEVIARYQTGWTYQDAFKTAFFMNEELSYDFTKNFAVYVSHTNDADALKANGVDTNMKAYDSNTSVFASGIKATF